MERRSKAGGVVGARGATALKVLMNSAYGSLGACEKYTSVVQCRHLCRLCSGRAGCMCIVALAQRGLELLDRAPHGIASDEGGALAAEAAPARALPTGSVWWAAVHSGGSRAGFCSAALCWRLHALHLDARILRVSRHLAH